MDSFLETLGYKRFIGILGILFVLIILIIFLASNMGTATNPTTNKIPAATPAITGNNSPGGPILSETYSANGISFRYPGNWQVAQRTFTSRPAMQIEAKDSLNLTIFSVLITQRTGESNQDELLAQGYTKTSIIVDNIQAEEYRSYVGEGQARGYLITNLNKDDKVYSLLLDYSATVSSAHELYRSIVQSFHFTDQ